MGGASTQPKPAEGAPDDGSGNGPGRPSAPIRPEPIEGDDALPGEGPGSPCG